MPARCFIIAIPLFEQIEIEADIPDFTSRRIEADNSSRGLEEIYHVLALPTEVMDLEIGLEFENAIPIRQNLQRVEDVDLLINDMYMSACDILRLLRGVGLDKQLTIFQSNKGKSSGAVWRDLVSSKPGRHVGDNVHSDFRLPKSIGFNCELYTGAALTGKETFLRQQDSPMLAYLLREIRFASVESGSTEFSSLAGQLNLPWLFFRRNLFAASISVC